MKIFKYVIIAFFIVSNYSYAAKLDDYIKIGQSDKNKVGLNSNSLDLNKALTNAVKSAQDDIISKLDKEIQKLQDNVDKNISQITGKFDKEIQKATDRINNDIIGKAENLVNDAVKQYNDIIKMKDNILSTLQSLMNNLPTYILMAKIILAIIVLGLFLLIFFFWRVYKNTTNIAKNILKLGDLEDIGEILAKLNSIENKVDKMLPNKKQQ